MNKEKDLRYFADRRKEIERKKLDRNPVNTYSKKIELHHISGRGNSEEVIPLCKNCHNFISIQQNSLSVSQRRDSLILALKSISAMQRLENEHLDLIIEKLIQEEEGEKKAKSSC